MIGVCKYERILCMKLTRLVLLVATMVAMSREGLFAHEGEEHGDTTKVKMEEGLFVLSAVTDNVEVVLKYPPTEPGKELKLLIYLSEYATNKPIKNAEIVIELEGLEGVKPKVSMTDLAGVYHAEVTLPDAKPYGVLLTITANDIVDLIPLSGIQAGTALHVGGTGGHSNGGDSSVAGKLVLGGGILLLLAGFGYTAYHIGKRRAIAQHS
jgi:hypothetical protein